jgi:hypothetical protein
MFTTMRFFLILALPLLSQVRGQTASSVPSVHDTSSLSSTPHHVIAIAVGSAVAVAGGFVILAVLVGLCLFHHYHRHGPSKDAESPKDTESSKDTGNSKDVEIPEQTRLSDKHTAEIDTYIENNCPFYLIRLSTRRLISKKQMKSHVKSKIRSSDMPPITPIVQELLNYAIFSHRWSDNEPNYQTVRDNGVDGCKGVGADKLRRFCEEAKEYGCEFAWSDTCCIDKSNQLELQESLNSMFKWYRNAGACIVHLAETLRSDDVDWTESMVDRTRRKCMVDDQWFKRGWTLQELLAPKKMRFYDQDWQPLRPTPPDKRHSDVNDKADDAMLLRIKTASHIPKSALMQLDQLPDPRSVFTWASGRETTKEEDMAYSLIGLVGVHLAVHYGEGERAFFRLQEAILERNPDRGLFVWRGRSFVPYSMLARHVSCFRPLDTNTSDAGTDMPDADPDIPDADPDMPDANPDILVANPNANEGMSVSRKKTISVGRVVSKFTRETSDVCTLHSIPHVQD